MNSSILLPQQYDSTPVYDLLRAAELGRIGFDLRLIRSITDRRDEALAALVRYTGEDRHEDRLVNLSEQCFDLFRYFRAPEAVPFYMEALKGAISDVPDELVEAFSELGAPALDGVLGLYETVGEDDRDDVTFLLAAMGVRDERVKTIFLDTLARDKYEGALCIGLYHDASLKPQVAEALASLPGNAKEERKALEACLQELEQTVEPEEAAEYDIFPLYPATSQPLFEAMALSDVFPFLTCDSSEYRAAAAMSFCDEEYQIDVRDTLIDRAQNDDSVEVRAAALRALGERVEDEPVVALLEATLTNQSESPEVRSATLAALALDEGNILFQSSVVKFYENEETRAAALEAMWRSLDARYKKYFTANLRHEDEEVRRAAVQGVGAFPISELAMELVPFFDNAELRDEALFSYALAVPGTITPKSANKFFDRIEERAGGMTEAESEMVAIALDRRLEKEGYRAHFFPEDEEDDEDGHHHHHHRPADAQHSDQPVRVEKIGRNDPCPCGSGKKYKKCCGLQ